MSHTSTIKSVPIRDIGALQSAIDELASERGIKISLEQNAKPRMYYSNQHGVCDYVVKLHDKPYDVGLQKQDDGSYSLVCDTWAGHVRKAVGVADSCPIDATPEEVAVGALMQSYAKHCAINTATAQGYIVESCMVDEDGEVQLTLAV